MKSKNIRSPRKVGILKFAFLGAILLPALSWPLQAQSESSATVEEYEPVALAPEELDVLLGPIALYPDALIALILPASTVPTDVILGARYLTDGDLDLVDEQPWDESVISLTRYPDVLSWMDENLEWTSAVGEAFYQQPDDVMDAIQRLRVDAQDAGNLVNTPQQTVLVEEVAYSKADNSYIEDITYVEHPYETREVIRIVPADPEIVYVPVYDPQVVYVESPRPDYVGNFISFGAGLAVGTWLSYDFDWGRRQVYYGDNCGYNNRGYWNNRGSYDEGRNVNIVETNTNITNVNTVTNIDNRNVDNRNVNRWQPSAASRNQISQRQRKSGGNARYSQASSPKQANQSQKPGSITNKQSSLPKPSKLVADGKRPAAGAKKNPGNNQKKNNQNDGKAQAAGPNNRNDANGNKPGNNANGNKKNTGSNNGNQSNQEAKKPSTAPRVDGNLTKDEKANSGNRNNNANPAKQADKARTDDSGRSKNQPTQSRKSEPPKSEKPAPKKEAQQQRQQADRQQAQRKAEREQPRQQEERQQAQKREQQQRQQAQQQQDRQQSQKREQQQRQQAQQQQERQQAQKQQRQQQQQRQQAQQPGQRQQGQQQSNRKSSSSDAEKAAEIEARKKANQKKKKEKD